MPDYLQVLVNNEKILMKTFGDQPSLFETIHINASVKDHPQNGNSVIGTKPGNTFDEMANKYK